MNKEKILDELEKYLKGLIDNFDDNVRDTIFHEQLAIEMIYDYIQELKEKYK